MPTQTQLERNVRINRLNKELNDEFLTKIEERAAKDPGYLKEKLPREVLGYCISRGGPHGLDIESAIYGFHFRHDEGTLRERGDSTLVLKFVLGSLQWVRYANRDVVIGNEAREYARKKLLPYELNYVG
jgi:hypothetical protein